MVLHNGRYFVFTWNNPNVDPDGLYAAFGSAGCSFLVLQREKGTEGTEHYQGYAEFSKNMGINTLKQLNSQMHWENRKGSQAQAIEYSSKEDTRVEGPWRFGTPKSMSNTGCSPDFQLAVKEGKRLRELHESFPDEMRKYPRYQEALREVYPPDVREGKPEVILLIGDPGSGKTRYVREVEDRADLYVKPCDRDFWMNGYDLHPAVLLDDFMGASNHVTLTNLLQLLDRYLITVSTKHGHTWWQPERMYVTTNIHPANWYEYQDRMVHYKALQRRFTQVIQFTETGTTKLSPGTLVDRPAWDQFWLFEDNHVQRVMPQTH